jgi:transcriptional regulator GlxA family with amidase domain
VRGSPPKFQTADVNRIASAAIRKAICRIQERFTERVSSRALAEFVGVSHEHFCRTFKQATGVHVTEYVTRLRIKRACDALGSCDDAINLVALECGFSSLTQFNRMFRKLVQKTPKEYRADSRRAIPVPESPPRNFTKRTSA